MSKINHVWNSNSNHIISTNRADGGRDVWTKALTHDCSRPTDSLGDETENPQVVEAAEVYDWNRLSESDNQDFISLPQ